MKTLIILILCCGMVACTGTGRYSQHKDSKPKFISKEIDFRDVEPRFEPYLSASLRPYRVLGQDYVPLSTGKGYSETGVASWYGQKFHGHLTANGETYNMFAMSAAHKTLPLPSFVKVTNLNNGRTAILRVNDRGPFHDDRVIDLSYAAAMKLGVLDTGTAPVQVDVIHIDEAGLVSIGNQPPTSPQDNQLSQQWFVQVAALQDQDKIDELAKGLELLFQLPVNQAQDQGLYKLQLGPLDNGDHAMQVVNELRQNGYHEAFRVQVMP